MADKTAIPIKTDFANVYKDTKYFIDAIIDEYGLYSNFINAVKGGAAEFDIKSKLLRKNIEVGWVEAIEEGITALDTVIRMPTKNIEDREEVLPIEMSNHITSRSLQHLAQHTDYINKIEGDMITPSKILNVFYEETLQTYENKFINTLIKRLFEFIDRRYAMLRGSGGEETAVSMSFSSDFEFGGSKGKIDLTIQSADDNGQSKGSIMLSRVKRLYSVAMAYLDSDFVKAIGPNYIHPPVMRTNAITKNKYLRQCLALWEFIESYDKVGYTIEVEEAQRKPDTGYLNELYSLLALQFMTFKYNLQNDFDETLQITDIKSTARPMAPRFNTKVKEIEVEDYNVYDSEYRRVVSVSQLSSKHRLSKSELQVRDAVEHALNLQKELVSMEREKQKEQKKLERQLEREKAKAERAEARRLAKLQTAEQKDDKPEQSGDGDDK